MTLSTTNPTPMERKAIDLDDLVSANMKKASAILTTMCSLHGEGTPMNAEITGNLLWAASDLLSQAIEAGTDFSTEKMEKGVFMRYQQVFETNNDNKIS